jgi:hypothetical protein
MEDLFNLLFKTLTSLFTILGVVLYTGMISRAWLWVIDLFGFCETDGRVVKKKDGKNGKNGMEKRKREVKVVRNRRVEEIKREEGCVCECEDCCEEEGEGKEEVKKEEWWESWVEV